jgi:hypothetical protein
MTLRGNANLPYRQSRVDDSSFFPTIEVFFEADMLKVSGDLRDESYLVPVGKKNYDDNITFEFDTNTDGPRARKMVEKWVGHCNGYHDRCRLEHFCQHSFSKSTTRVDVLRLALFSAQNARQHLCISLYHMSRALVRSVTSYGC